MNYRKYIYTFLFIVYSSSFIVLDAQQHKVDSLLNVLKTEKEDTNKVNTLNALSSKLYDLGKYDSSLTCANGSEALADKLGYKKGMVRALVNIGMVYKDQGNYPKALEHYFRGLKMSEELGDEHLQATTLSNIGIVYEEQGDYPKALEYDFKVLKMDEKLGDKDGQASTIGNIGVVYIEQGDYPKALEYYFKALKMDEEMGDKVGTAINTGNIGIVYEQQGDYPKALEYYFKALKMSEELGDKKGIATNTGNIGNASQQQGNYPKALEFYFQALKMDEELGDKSGQSGITGNIGNIYAGQGNYPKALEYDFKALKMSEELGDKYSIASFTGNIARDYTKQKNYKQAKIEFDSTLILSKKIGAKDIIRDDYSGLAMLDSATSNYKAEIDDYRLYILYRDSLINEANTKKSVQAEMNFEFEQKQNAEKAEQDKKDARQRIITWSVLSGLLLVIVFAGFILRSLRITRKQKQLIEAKSKETEEQKKVIEEKNKDILDSITYAKRLQDAILPPLSLIKQYLPESFVLYKPKDIVAGDFYWMERFPLPQGEGQGEVVLIAAADCTGHGVPGAMVSVVCSNALNRTVKEFKITEPGKILDKVRELVWETFEKSEANVQDGMDISLGSINTKTYEAQWSGAHNPLIYLSKGEMKEVPADKQPIGKVDKPLPFSTHRLNLQKGDSLYLFTDGYADQFGGPKGKKFRYKQLSDKLSAISGQSMAEQKNILEETFANWKGSLEQVDDILVIGIRV
jgi:tetratricopeptide (TPR) repeat protein